MPTQSLKDHIREAFSPETSRRLFEEAQRKRARRAQLEKRKGLCTICHKEPYRGPWDTKCSACHAAKHKRWKQRHKVRLALQAKEERKKERARAQLRKTMNPAYAAFALPPPSED